jgi:hypothetical protein
MTGITGETAAAMRRAIVVTAGLDPAIHVFLGERKAWMPATNAGMTATIAGMTATIIVMRNRTAAGEIRRVRMCDNLQ